MMRNFILVVAVGIFLPSKILAANIEVTLIDDLDGNLNGYCLDIVGGGQNIDPVGGLQAHTCYSYRGELGADQAIDSERIDEGVFYLPAFDVCATMLGVAAGSKVGLDTCAENKKTTVYFF